VKKIIYLALAIIILIFLFSWPFFLKVTIKCQSQYGKCDSEINKSLSIYNGKSLFNAKKGVDSSLKTNYLISGHSLQFKLPDILMVNVLIKKPVFALQDSSGHEVLVSIDGEVLSAGANSALPTVKISQEVPMPGQNVGQTNLFTLKIISGVFEMYGVGIGAIQNDSLVVDLPAQIRVIFPLEGDSQTLLGALKLIYTKTQGDLAGKFSQIDLRYVNPVLR